MKPADNSENELKCICGKCPVYDKCAEEKKEALYCARGKSNCKLDGGRMCICGECPVYIENELSGGYFCINDKN